MPAVALPHRVTLKDAGRWHGVRLEQWEGFGEEPPETTLPHHAVVVTLDPMIDAEVKLAGDRWRMGDYAGGTLAVLPAGLAYRARRRPRGLHCRKLVLAVAPRLLDGVLGAPSRGARELRPSFGSQDAFVEQLLRALARDVVDGYPSGALYGDSLIVALAAHLGQHHASERPGSDDARRARVRDFILAQLDAPLSLAQLAGAAQLDVHRFSRWFKAAFGAPPHRYVVLARVDRARQLLTTTRRSLADIALACGFSSQSHFASTFRRFTGTTPGAYR